MQADNKNWVNWHEFMPKEEADNFDFGSTAVVSKLAFLLVKQAGIMGMKIPISLGENRLDLARPLLCGISSNALAIVNLAKNSFGNEIYPIARSLIERIITFYYLQSCSESELENYIDYSKQKTYRLFHREIIINNKKFSVSATKNINLSEFPDLKIAVDKYTSPKKKKPITRWSNLSLQQKLSIIDSAGEINIVLPMIALLVIYDDASEALHGTMYGCTFHAGAFKPHLSLESYQEVVTEHLHNLTTIYILFGTMMGDINRFVADKCALNELYELADAVNNQIKDIWGRCLRRHH
jgi:hypothetical protein